MTPRLLLLPGLGADARLFGPQLREFPDLVVPPWLPPQAGQSLPDYARRMAETIGPERPLVLGGCSLGGMVAYEMARHVRPDALVLIGSCRTREGIRAMFRSLHALAERLPARVLDVAKLLAPLAVGVLGSLTPGQRLLCSTMFREADSAFMQWALAAILDWEPSPPGDTPVFQIHGRQDHLIPAGSVAADELIPDGGHVINLTHPDIVNAFLRRAIAPVA